MKLFKMLAPVLCALALCGCGGNVRGVRITEADSVCYTQSEISSAVDAAVEYFDKYFEGCTLVEIGYAGDRHREEALEWAETYQAEDAVILTSVFDVDSSGGDGSLNPNSRYGGWQWIMVKKNGRWQHADHGY